MRVKNQTFRLLQRKFFTRAPDVVARDLLGKILIHETIGVRLSGRIIETEAYLGLDDPASHAYRGQSSANAVLFGPPGLAHVYLIYGLHHCLNIAAHREEHAGGVLLRAVLPMEGMEVMSKLRGRPGITDAKWLTGGPGKVCQAFGINRDVHNAEDVTRASSTLRIMDDGSTCPTVSITKRIGITKAADAPLRFLCQVEFPRENHGHNVNRKNSSRRPVVS